MTRRKRLRITGTLYPGSIAPLAGGLCPLTRLCLETMRDFALGNNFKLAAR